MEHTMLITGEALYWFFSTIAQTLGAIVGVVGMLTVFKLQNITTYTQQIVDRTFQQRNGVFPNGKAYTQTPKDIIIDFKEKYPDVNIDMPKKDFRASGIFEVVYLACLRILNSFDRYKKIKNRFLTLFLIPQLTAIYVSINLVLFSKGWAYTIDKNLTFSLWVIFLCLLYLSVSTLIMVLSLMKAD